MVFHPDGMYHSNINSHRRTFGCCTFFRFSSFFFFFSSLFFIFLLCCICIVCHIKFTHLLKSYTMSAVYSERESISDLVSFSFFFFVWNILIWMNSNYLEYVPSIDVHSECHQHNIQLKLLSYSRRMCLSLPGVRTCCMV